MNFSYFLFWQVEDIVPMFIDIGGNSFRDLVLANSNCEEQSMTSKVMLLLPRPRLFSLGNTKQQCKILEGAPPLYCSHHP